jgi:nucleotide-binding universal stress UspA family protein
MFTKMLVCSDGSEQALKAAQAAAEIARKFESKVVLVSVFNPAQVPNPFVGVPGTEGIADGDIGDFADRVQTDVEQATGRVFAAAGVRYESRRELGHPVDRIVAAAAEEQSDLIVLGSRGLGGFRQFVLGSVSDGVLHHAHCPVLIVR